jgi:hypothetical protein
MMARWSRVLVAVAICGAGLGCDDGADSNGNQADTGIDVQDAGVKDLAIWDAGDGEVVVDPQRDLGPEPDRGVQGCLAEGGALQLGFESEALPGAVGVRADIDVDDDGMPEILLTWRDPNGMRLSGRTGQTFESLGQGVLRMAQSVEFMPNTPADTGLITPLPGGLFGAWARTAEAHQLYAIRATDFEAVAVPLPQEAERVQFAGVGQRALAFVDFADQGCALYDLGMGAELASQGQCTFRPAWDVNGDSIREIARSGGDGTVLLDGVTLELVAQNPLRMQLGPRPADLRGQGPEIAALSTANGTTLHFLDPIDLTELAQASITGDFVRMEIHDAGMQQRILLEEERLNLRYLRIIEPNGMARRRAELGSYRQLQWHVGPDVDGDGVADLQVLGGSTEDGTNTDVAYFQLEDGSLSYTIEAERSARFIPIFGNAGKGPVPQDLDGCAGVELVALRQGAESAAGTRPTRIHVYGPNERIGWRSEPYTTFAHDLAVSNLDGTGPSELIELRADAQDEAKIRIWRAVE